MDIDPLTLVSAPNVSTSKVEKFNKTIPLKKSHHAKAKEALDKKAKEEEDLAAQAYLDFVQVFDAEGPSNNSNANSSRGSGSGNGFGARSRSGAKGFVRAGGGEGYNPLKDQEIARRDEVPTGPRGVVNGPTSTTSSSNNSGGTSIGSIPTGPRSSYNRPNVMQQDEPELPKVSGPPGKKKRDGDNFLEELKRDQKEREDRLSYHAGRAGTSVTALAAREHAPVLTGSYDSGDPLTTNVHVAGLPSTVNEQTLGMYFARWGPIGSVKIMWPRLDGPNAGALPAPTARRQLGGFVAFLRRPDAEVALKEIDGSEWCGVTLRCSWGKTVPLPRDAIYEIEGSGSRNYGGSSRREGRSRYSSDEDRRYHQHSSSTKRRKSSYSSDDSRSRSRSRSRSPKWERARRNWPALDTLEEDKFLRTIAGKVKEHGEKFELVLKEKERDNPKFAFFRDPKLPAYHFFKMLLDSEYSPPSSSDPVFLDEGNADIYSSDSAEDSERDRVRKGKLGKLAQRRFECMLRGLTSTRERIARGMAFALEHADAAVAIVDLLVASLTLPSTPVPRKIARLHLISDILHNSATSIPNAWVYRSTLERKLPIVFDHLGEIYLSFPGRMKAEQFKMQVINIVDVWERDWIVFEPTIIEDLKRRLSGESESQEPTAEDYEMAKSLSSASSSSSHLPLTTLPPKNVVVEDKPMRKVSNNPGFKTSSFLPSDWNSELPEEIIDSIDVDGEDLDGEDVDGVNVDGEEVVDAEVIPLSILTEVKKKRPTAIEVEDEERAMKLGSDDDDMF